MMLTIQFYATNQSNINPLTVADFLTSNSVDSVIGRQPPSQLELIYITLKLKVMTLANNHLICPASVVLCEDVS
jgi:hypothetical protein